jgi:hypothetical protein
MGKYVLAYTGGAMGASPEEQQAVLDRWMAWFGSLGPALLDGGNPFGPSTTIRGDDAAEGGASSLTGYSIISASDLGAATETAKGCPALAAGGTVEVYEAIEMG